MINYIFYFVPPLLFIVYCELLGRSILSYFKNDYLYGFHIGFFALLAGSYVFTSLLSLNKCSFYVILFTNILIMMAGLVLVILRRKKMKLKFDAISIVIVTLTFAFLMYYSFNTTLGDLHGFDSTYYLNLVCGNIGKSVTNNFDPYFGDGGNRFIPTPYSMQSYYYFAASLLFVIQKIANILGVLYYPVTGFIWFFQSLYFLLFISLIEETRKLIFKDKTYLYILMHVVFIIFYARVYFNNVYGFYGNSIKTIVYAFASLFLFECLYLNDQRKKYLFYICLISAISFSSSSSFISLFYLFGTFFVLHKCDTDVFKEYAVVMFFVLANLFCVVFYYLNFKVLTILMILCLAVYCLNDLLFGFFDKYRLDIVIVGLVSICMFVLSRKVSSGLFDFSGFWNNTGKIYDMVIYFNSFNYRSLFSSKNIYILITTGLLVLNLIFNYKNKMVMIYWVLIICLLNPFCCNYLNSLNKVYYRTYDIIINPFTVSYMLYCLSEKIGNRKMEISFCVVLIAALIYKTPLVKPQYFHKSFIASDDYNALYKMDNDELEIINELKAEMVDKENARILTPNVLTQSMLQKGEYFFGRTFSRNSKWSDSDLQLYGIFYPTEYYDQKTKVDFEIHIENTESYLKESDVSYIVLDKDQMFYDEKQDLYYPFYYVVDEYDSTEVIFQNESFILFRVV